MSLSNIPLEQTRTNVGEKRSSNKRLFTHEMCDGDDSCLVCLEKDFQPAMKMCPSCRRAFHSQCIAGWLLEFANSTCPHCRTRLTYQMLEDVEVVLPLKVLCTSSMQTIGQTRPTMRGDEYQASSMTSLNGSRIAQLTVDSEEHSPVSPVWSPVSPYPNFAPSITVSPVITVGSFPGSSASTSPVVNSSAPIPLPQSIPESPLPQTLRSTAPLVFSASTSADPHASTASNESSRNVWSFIAEQLRREGWQTVDPNPTLPSPNTALPSFSNAFETQ